MNTFRWSNWYLRVGVASYLAMGGAIALAIDGATAQIIPDSTLGSESSVVTPNRDINGSQSERIDGGAIRGANLFHSFQEFNVGEGRGAYFTNQAGIENIFSRVTGSNPSNIFGKLGVLGNGNLFLINPNGIIFGANANLDVKGSFVGTTANAVRLGETGLFSASEPATSNLLTVKPSALFFNALSSQGIVNRSTATSTVQGSPTKGLQVPNGQSLLLVGGNVSLDGGTLLAPGGRVELGGVAGMGTVGLNFDGNTLSLNFPDGVERADVSLANGAKVDVTAGSGGSIAVNAGNINVLSGSSVAAGIGAGLGTVGAKAGDITLNATNATTITQSSRINNNFAEDAIAGEAGDINIQTGSLLISNFSKVDAGQDRTSAIDRGDSGNITVRAKGDIFIDTNGSRSDIALSTLAFSGKGNAGYLSVQAGGNISILDSDIVTSSFGGSGGDILLQANGSISISNNSFIASNIFFSEQGKAGNVSLLADGPISIANISIITTSVGSSEAFTEGNGGNIYVQGRSLSVTGGGRLSSKTSGRGDAGRIQVNTADFVEVSGRYPTIRSGKQRSPIRLNGEGYSAFLTTSEDTATGSGGEITVTTDTLRVLDGGTLTARSKNQSRGGNINVNAKVLEVSGGGQLITTGFSSGDAGDINLNVTDRITISGSNLSFFDIYNQIIKLVNNDEQEAERLIGGPIGPIGSSSGIFANTATGGEGGNITIQGGNILLRNNGIISTEASSNGNGGNITINADTLIGIENGDIVANANEGKGGSIKINAQGIFGIERREQLTPQSDITTFSQQNPELNGVVEINTPDVEVQSSLTELVGNFVSPEQVVAGSCLARRNVERGSFTITGTGGLPSSPYEAINGRYSVTDVQPLQGSSNISSRTAVVETAAWKRGDPIQEAQGMVVTADGRTVIGTTSRLVALAKTDNLVCHPD